MKKLKKNYLDKKNLKNILDGVGFVDHHIRVHKEFGLDEHKYIDNKELVNQIFKKYDNKK